MKIHHGNTRMSMLVRRPGGITRDVAVHQAAQFAEKLREPCEREITERITELEHVCIDRSTAPVEKLTAIMHHCCDCIIALAGSFGMGSLVRACQAFADLALEFQRLNQFHGDAIAVHIRAIRLLAPGSNTVSSGEVEIMMRHLEMVLQKFRAVEDCFEQEGVNAPAGQC